MNLTGAPDGYHINGSLAGDGLIGGYLPVAHYVLPLEPNAANSTQEERLSWDMIAVAVPCANGSRENYVWFRYQQRACAARPARSSSGALQDRDGLPPDTAGTSGPAVSCRVVGHALYYGGSRGTNNPRAAVNSISFAHLHVRCVPRGCIVRVDKQTKSIFFNPHRFDVTCHYRSFSR